MAASLPIARQVDAPVLLELERDLLDSFLSIPVLTQMAIFVGKRSTYACFNRICNSLNFFISSNYWSYYLYKAQQK